MDETANLSGMKVLYISDISKQRYQPKSHSHRIFHSPGLIQLSCFANRYEFVHHYYSLGHCRSINIHRIAVINAIKFVILSLLSVAHKRWMTHSHTQFGKQTLETRARAGALAIGITFNKFIKPE